MGRFLISFFLLLTFFTENGRTQDVPPPQYYRDLIKTVRTKGSFKVFLPNGQALPFSYELTVGEPKGRDPIIADLPSITQPGKFEREFYDKIYLKDGSVLKLGDEQLPLTCIHVSGQDNRFSGKKTPLIPDLIFKIIFVANDFSCSGPITPGWPESGGRKEAWSTYLFYVVKDPTIMLPVDAKIRYRWNEFEAVLAGP
jgi:hypothetical protein